jgi:hypothetical protein
MRVIALTVLRSVAAEQQLHDLVAGNPAVLKPVLGIRVFARPMVSFVCANRFDQSRASVTETHPPLPLNV